MFVPNFALLAEPLTRLRRGWKYEQVDGHTRLVDADERVAVATKVPIEWGPPQQRSFEALRDRITHPPVLVHPDPGKPYLLYTDASKEGLAAILHQIGVATTSPLPDDLATVHHLTTAALPTELARRRWATWLLEDRYFAPILRGLESGQPQDDWVLQGGGLLVRRLDDELALPELALPEVLRDLHDKGGHFGFVKTLMAVRRRFWRPSLSTAVRAWVKHCRVCLHTKRVPKTGVLNIDNDPSTPFEAVSLDLVYSFPRSQAGNDSALVIQDLFSRMVLISPCAKDIDAVGVAALFSDRVFRFGWRPRRIVSDSEARVSGHMMSALVSSIGADLTPSSPYHQQANAVERAIQTIQQVLRAMALDSKTHWDRRVAPTVELALNSIPSLTIGYRPFDLVYLSPPEVVHAVFDSAEHLGVGSFEERLAMAHERLRDANEAIRAAREEQKRRYDRRRVAPPPLAPGMEVWLRLEDRPVTGALRSKLDARKLGPFPIEDVLSPHRVRLSLPADVLIDPVVNVEQLDFSPTDPDPFLADRAPPPDAATPPRPLPSSDPRATVDNYAAASEADGAASRSCRARALPRTMREFQLGTVSTAAEVLGSAPTFRATSAPPPHFPPQPI